MSNAEEVDLPEGMEPDGHDDGYPDDYAPPPPPPDEGGGEGEPEDPVSRASREPLNDLGNARRFVIHFGDDILFVSQVGWFVWDGSRWRKDDEISAMCRR